MLKFVFKFYIKASARIKYLYSGLEMAREMTGGQLLGAQIRSTEVTFRPEAFRPGHYLGDTKTAGYGI